MTIKGVLHIFKHVNNSKGNEVILGNLYVEIVKMTIYFVFLYMRRTIHVKDSVIKIVNFHFLIGKFNILHKTENFIKTIRISFKNGCRKFSNQALRTVIKNLNGIVALKSIQTYIRKSFSFEHRE